MTDSIVTVEETPVKVSLDTGTPVTTITDNTTGSITIVDAAPIAVEVVNDQPIVVVRTGSGGSLDLTSIMAMLAGKLTLSQMDMDLYQDLTMLQALWTRIGTDLLLTVPEGEALQEAGRLITNQSIIDAVLDITVSTDGKITANTSLINQTADGITQLVTALEGSVNGIFSTYNTRINQTAYDINTTATALETANGLLSVYKSEIDQNAYSISLKVTQQQVDESGTIITLGSRITLTEETIALAVTAFNDTTTRVDAAEITIAANAITLSNSTQYLTQKVETIQTLTSNQWGVIIEEDINGVSYVAGFGLLLHPSWVLSDVYAVNDTVYFNDIAYTCISGHTANATNSPGNTTYWTINSSGAKSEFVIAADKFKVIAPDNAAVSLFTVDATTNAITLNSALVVISGTLIFEAIETDSDEVRDILNVADGADATANSDFVNTTYPADQTALQTQLDGKVESWFQSTDPQSSWTGTDLQHTGDMWWNTSTLKLKRYSGTAWSAELTDQTALTAYSTASAAAATADGKMTVFTTTPTNYNIGDLWDYGGTPRLLKRSTGSSSSYNSSHWTTVVANAVTSTSHISDGAGLGNTSTWSGVTGTGKPANYATYNYGSLANKSTITATEISSDAVTAPKVHTDALQTCKFYCSNTNTTAYSTYLNYTYSTGTATAVAGINTVGGGTGLYGQSSSSYGYGIRGYCSSSGKGVSGTSSSGVGVAGTSSTNAAGVLGTSAGGYGVRGTTTGTYGLYTDQKLWVYGGAYPFTGVHLSFSKSILAVGDIVCSEGAILTDISNSYVFIGLPTTSYNKRVFGVVQESEETTDILQSKLIGDVRENATIFNKIPINERTIISESDNSDMGKKLGDKEIINDGYEYTLKPSKGIEKEGTHPENLIDVFESKEYHVAGINALGEGGINVCPEGGDIEIGDYICTSSTPGKGMKQDDDLLHNYTVAKSLQNYSWGKKNSKPVMIACTYHCG